MGETTLRVLGVVMVSNSCLWLDKMLSIDTHCMEDTGLGRSQTCVLARGGTMDFKVSQSSVMPSTALNDTEESTQRIVAMLQSTSMQEKPVLAGQEAKKRFWEGKKDRFVSLAIQVQGYVK
jgi:hypothetical protein